MSRSFAEQVAVTNAINLAEVVEDKPDPVTGTNGRVIIDLDADEDSDESTDDTSDTPLRNFLASSMLSTDTETQEARDDKSAPKVTISTCHAAKGLEWPVVFLPAGKTSSLSITFVRTLTEGPSCAAETGVYPAFRKSETNEVAEER